MDCQKPSQIAKNRQKKAIIDAAELSLDIDFIVQDWGELKSTLLLTQ